MKPKRITAVKNIKVVTGRLTQSLDIFIGGQINKKRGKTNAL